MNKLIVKGELLHEAKNDLARLLYKIDELELQKERMMELIKQGMEEADIKKIDSDFFTITYIEPTTRVSIDQKKLKEHYEEVYIECTKESQVKSSIRIKVK